MAEIDRLEVQIEAEAKDANAQLDKMLEKLESLSKKLEAISKNNGFEKISSNAGSITKNVNGINRFATGFTALSSSIKDTGKQAFELAFALGKVYTGIKIIQKAAGLITKSIDISSRLTEVQNVVDVTFGKYRKKIEELASGSIENFGMSELTTKEIASRFQAMGTAMGFSTGKMSEMSVGLTKLAADMASFYNVDQEKVAKSLESVFTGQTRPLRTYGLDLSQATLKEWALKQGIDADIQAMSQAEKTLLRYQYVMANTSAAQGDFARTSNTWANQVRILQQQLQALAGTIGGVFINALKPMVAAMNRILEKVREFAKTIADSLGTIFGWTVDVGSGGLANDFTDIEDSTENTAGNLGQAAAAAKKLKTIVLGIDELNINNSNNDSGSGSGFGGSAAGVGGSGLDIVKTDSVLDKWKSEIDNLYDLGAYIGSAITKALNSIEWEKVYESARNFGKGLADFLNGLISPELFGAVGQTVAGCLNTAIYGSLSFAENFDWSNFGQSIASGINKFFETFDFKALAENLNTWVDGIKTTIGEIIENVDWSKVLQGFYDFFSSIEIDTAVFMFGALAFRLAGKVLTNKVVQEELTKQIFGKIAESGITISLGTIVATLTSIAFSAPNLIACNDFANELLEKISEAMEDLLPDWAFDLLSKMGAGMVMGAALGMVAGPAGTIAGAIMGAIGGALWSQWDKIVKWWNESIGKWWSENVAPWFTSEKWNDLLSTIKDEARNIWNETVLQWKSNISKWWNENVAPWFTSEKWKSIYTSIKDSLKTKWDETVLQWKSGITSWWNENVAPWFTAERWKNLYTTIKTSLKTKWDETVTQWKANIQSWWDDHVAPWFTSDKWSGIAKNIKDSILGKFGEMVSDWKEKISAWWKDHVEKYFSSSTWSDMGKNMKENLISGFKGVANGVIGILNNVLSGFEDLLNKVVSGINKIIDKINDNKIADFVGIKVGHVGKVSVGRIPTFAEGGYPETGQLFMARENGMNEFVGSIGNRSAVANNDQIVAGIKQGVYEAMTEAMQYMMSQSTEQPIIVQTTVEMDGKAIVQQTDKARRRMGWNFQPI